MLKAITLVAISALAVAVMATPQPAFARDNGAVAAGVIGGLAVGAIVGSQIDHRRGYRDHTAVTVTTTAVIAASTATAASSDAKSPIAMETSIFGAFASAIDALVCANLEGAVEL